MSNVIKRADVEERQGADQLWKEGKKWVKKNAEIKPQKKKKKKKD